jgi:hypothetical protein
MFPYRRWVAGTISLGYISFPIMVVMLTEHDGQNNTVKGISHLIHPLSLDPRRPSSCARSLTMNVFSQPLLCEVSFFL